MKKYLLIIFILINCILFAEDKTKDLSISYNSITQQGIVFSWRINRDLLDVKVIAPTSGWISVGFDPKYKMQDANLIIGYVKDGKVFIQDDYGTGAISHKSIVSLGGKDCIINASGIEKDKTTELSFSLPTDSKDKYHKVFSKGKHKVILAYSHNKNFTSKHAIVTSTIIDIE